MNRRISLAFLLVFCTLAPVVGQTKPAAGNDDVVRITSNLDRLFVTSALPLSPDLEPGSYYLQVVITDKNAKNKQPPVVQWVNFEIVK
jgi:hypothetical protein